jgi:glycosyltransferase involved in cell wall biosynthesis
MNLHVDIVIPTYNRAAKVAAAIRSALGQGYERLGVIVVDDGSTDDTREVVRAFPDPRLTYVRQPENIGMVRNWEHGFRLAEGEFVVLLGDDDVLEPDFVVRRVARLASDATLAVAFSGYRRVNDEGEVLDTFEAPGLAEKVIRGIDLLQAAASHEWFIGSSLYRREALLKAWPNVRSDGFALDYSLNIHIALMDLGAGVRLPGADLRYGWHVGSMTNSQRPSVAKDVRRLLERLADGAPGRRQRAVLEKHLLSWYVAAGRIEGSCGRIHEARALFWRAIRRDPSYLQAWKQYAVCSIFKSRFVKSTRRQWGESPPS